ncbi:alpha/beta hydrolase [Sphaerimonospora thailandensis]|uniref:alpha/beta hydrolase n=1 Tax=Sphaerimonospora thailandensis TaxID=795644 RepID=UPI0019521E43|nr:alpha/beta hydrolase [Sphaerimonospora thailandensis]
MLDTEVSELLKVLNEGFPPVHRMTGAEARAVVAARRVPVDNLDDVRSAEDRTIDTDDGPLRLRIYHPHDEGGAPLPVIVFFHGGGFVFCDLDSHDGFCRRMSRHTRSVVVSVDYRLAPEHRAPAAARDAYAAVKWVADNAAELGADSGRIVTAGDSAGGNLAAVVCLMARDLGGPPIAAQVLIYPVVEPSFDSDSYRRYATGYFNTRAAMEWYWQQYLGGDAVPEPAHQVAPLRAADHAGLPPAVIVTAGLDPLCDEGRDYAAALTRSGVPVIHRHYPGLFHGFLTIAALGPAVSARDLLWTDIGSVLT